MSIDRLFQNQILNIAAKCYPFDVNHELDELFKNVEERKIAANLWYLAEHKLIKDKPVEVSLDGFISLGNIGITHRGLDFLADDGGLSAILNVVTVKFEADTLKSLIAIKINQSDLTPENKKSMIDALEELPAESIKHLTMKLLDECVDNLPAAILLIGTWLSSF
ncbi:hypothetical protein [Acinetobacter sp. YH12251]|uniref:hypothetical protein n=1 Tax=Acinetobacter sp. YH12251 TaxID=2601176 RepID=UPI00211EA7C7|nr:hypothetical protein [Acinetobacter sp. YH12251]